MWRRCLFLSVAAAHITHAAPSGADHYPAKPIQVQEFIAAAKAKPGSFNFTSTGDVHVKDEIARNETLVKAAEIK